MALKFSLITQPFPLHVSYKTQTFSSITPTHHFLPLAILSSNHSHFRFNLNFKAMTSKGLKYMIEMFSMLGINFTRSVNLSNSVSLKNKMSLFVSIESSTSKIFSEKFLAKIKWNLNFGFLCDLLTF